MLKKVAFISILSLTSQLYAANCTIPEKRFDWEDKFCQPGSNCIIKWKDYGWWTNFHANERGYFYESKQAYDPRNAVVDNQGRLVLKIRKSDLGGGKGWTAAEAVLVSKDGNPFNIGYGHYLVSIETPVPISEMDRATVFGAFTYFRKAAGRQDVQASGGDNNLKELDMMELSKWGWTGQGDCPFKGQQMEEYGCHGSGQVGAQPWAQNGALKRFPEKGQADLTDTQLTMYMFWENENTPVKYKVFKGKIDMQTAKTQQGDVYNWELENKKFSPSEKDDCVRFHLNFYRPVYSSSGQNPDTPEQIAKDAARNINVQPQNDETVIYVTNFEYEAKAR